MTAVILTIQALIVLALIGVVLLQRSDGAGGLGMGGGGGGGGMMSARGTANALTRTTTILAGLFFANSLIFSLVVGDNSPTADFLPGEQEDLRTDDFSDFLSVDADDTPVEADPFALPDDLGISSDAPADAAADDGDEPSDDDEPQL